MIAAVGGWHGPDLRPNALCGSAKARVVEQRANRVSDGGGGRLVATEAASGACRDHGVGVGVLIGALWHDEEGQAMRKGAERCARPSMSDHRLTMRQHLRLRDVAADHDVVGLRAENRWVVPLPDGDYQRDRLVAQRGDDRAKRPTSRFQTVPIVRYTMGKLSSGSSHSGRAVEIISAAAGRRACTAGSEAISEFCRDGGHVSTYKYPNSPATGWGSRPRARQCGAAASPAARNRNRGISLP